MESVIKKGAKKDQIRLIFERLRKKRLAKVQDISKYCGILASKEDPLALQKKWRDEW